jgi:hypothetical protein
MQFSIYIYILALTSALTIASPVPHGDDRPIQGPGTLSKRQNPESGVSGQKTKGQQPGSLELQHLIAFKRAAESVTQLDNPEPTADATRKTIEAAIATMDGVGKAIELTSEFSEAKTEITDILDWAEKLRTVVRARGSAPQIKTNMKLYINHMQTLLGLEFWVRTPTSTGIFSQMLTKPKQSQVERIYLLQCVEAFKQQAKRLTNLLPLTVVTEETNTIIQSAKMKMDQLKSQATSIRATSEGPEKEMMISILNYATKPYQTGKARGLSPDDRRQQMRRDVGLIDDLLKQAF